MAIGSRPTQDLVSLGIDPRRILTLSSGLDLARLSELRAQAVREPGLIVSVGSLIAMKNHGLLIEAVHRLRRTRPGIRLIIAGEGPDRSLLRRLSGSDGAIELVGQLSAEEVYGLVRRAEVFVLASRRLAGKAEGVPTAALEALALGTPVVLSSDATLDPVVPADGTYQAFQSGSLDGLVAVLGDVLDDEESRNRMSAMGVRATAALGWPEVANKIEDWYRMALDAGPKDGVTLRGVRLAGRHPEG
jgi:glycosyltransferase involved in cell wall biosynthesis